MKIDTMLWLLLPVFMLHDFEEIILVSPWKQRQAEFIRTSRFSRWMEPTLRLSTPAFALAVAVMFTGLAVATLICVEYRLYGLWTGILLIFSIHLLAHMAQAVIVGGYIPALATSLLASVYSVFAIPFAFTHLGVTAGQALLYTLGCLPLVAGLLVLAIKAGGWFEDRLKPVQAGREP